MEPLMLLLHLLALTTLAAAQSCQLKHKVASVERSFASCKDLEDLGATLAWTHIPKGNELDVVFTGRASSPTGWVAWGINPGASPLMIGSHVFLAFRANGTNMLQTYQIPNQDALGNLQPGPLGFKVLDKSVEITGTSMKMYMRFQLPNNKTRVNHIWNRGPGMTGLSPVPHGPNDRGVGTIDISSGTASGSSLPHQKLKNRHGIINAVGWGLLLPLGVMSARYLKSFESADPAWFYIHAFCQSSGYILGVVGWATGLKLASYTPTVRYKHRNLGIAIFTFATLQVLSLLLRPKKEHKVRKYWNIYHHTIGYATIAMILVNIFEGFDILQPDNKWKHAYIGVIAGLGGVSLILEIVTWIIYFHRKSRSPPETIKVTSGNGAAVKNWTGATQA